MYKLTVVSFNMRLQTTTDGENAFFHRLPLIKETIEKKRPDIICAQEITDEMRPALADALPLYTAIGAGRCANRRGEGVLTLFRRDRFALSELQTVWLSDTPTVPNSRYEGSDQSPCPRVMTAALLVPFDAEGAPFRVYNLHTDHVGKESRMRASRDLLDKIRADRAVADHPYMVMGDFNAEPNSPEMRLLSESTDPVLRDVTTAFETTFHDYGRKKEPAKIDYIFLSPEWKSGEALLWTERRDSLYLSDHHPVAVDIEM